VTDEEAKNRADRIVCLDLPKDLLAQEIARELQRVVLECEWRHRDVLNNLQALIQAVSEEMSKK